MPAPLYAQDVPDGPRRVIGQVGALPLANGGMVELDGPDRRLVFRTAAGMTRTVVLPDSLGAVFALWAADADGSGAYVRSAGLSGHIKIVRVDRESGAPTTILEHPLAQLPYVLAAQRGVVVYATWPPGDYSGRATIWQVRPGEPSKAVTILPFACDAETLTMSADGRRFACARRTGKPDLFMIEGFDRYRD